MKKAVSVATSAALLASLLATAVAPAAFASATVAGVGNVGRSTTSANAATFTFTEEATPCLFNAIGGATAANAPVDLLVQIVPKAPVAGSVQFVGTPVLTAPGWLGASAAVVQSVAGLNDTLRIRIYGGDASNKSQISVTGLKVKASSGATLGAIQTILTSNDGNVLAACFLGATQTATGTVSAAIGISAVNQTVNIAVSSGTFDETGTLTGTVAAGKLVFATGESVDIVTAGAVVGGIQTLTIGPTTVVHNANEAVSQTGVATVIPFPYALTSVGTVTNSVRQDVWVPGGGLPTGGAGALTQLALNVNPGEQNQPTNSTYIYERSGVDATTGSAGFIAKNTVLTFTIDAAGVLFSTSPSVRPLDATLAGTVGSPEMALDDLAAGAASVCVISFDRKSCTTKVTAATTNSLHQAAISLYNITVDVDSTVAKGTPVNIVVTGVAVSVDYNTVAYASRVIVGVAAQPTIFINYNDQQSGMMTLTESGAGFFEDASVYLGRNVFGLCVTSGETFTRAPWAVVSTGDLKLLSGLVGATSVQGTLFNGGACAYWTVFSASTVASTVDIRGSDSANAVLPSGALNGPRYSVPPTAVPGATLVNILVGDKATVVPASGTGGGISSKVSNAIRAFKDSVVVTALSQPTIIRGTSSLAGNIRISETLAGQLKFGDVICLQIQPRASNFNLQDTWFDSSTTNQLPIVTTSANGLLVGPVSVGGSQDGRCTSAPGGDNRGVAGFAITQQAFGTLGVLTISNIHYITTADAPNGLVTVRVYHYTGGTGVAFSTYVNNAVVGVKSALAIGAYSALGLKPAAGYTTKTPKYTTVGKYVTWKFAGGTALAGQRVNVLVARKVGGIWGPVKYLKSAWADANGIVTFAWKSSTAAWINVRVQWPGNASYSVSYAKGLAAVVR